MAYTIVNCGRTQYAVDWEVVERLCRSYWFSYYREQYSTLTKMSESRLYNPFTWSMPEIQTVEIDWDKVRSATAMAVAKDMLDYAAAASSDMRSIAYHVKFKIAQTAFFGRSMRDWLREVQATNASAMQQAERDYTGLIDACRFVRDTSADVIAIGSTIATGGAGAGLLAGSSTLKGIYKYQDTGRAGAAVLYGGGSMALGAFKLSGAKLTTGGEYVLILAQGFLEGGTSLASGKSFADAVASGGLKIAGAGTAQAVFASGLVKNVFAKMPVPFTVFSEVWRRGHEYMAEDVADKLAEKTFKKLLEKGVKADLSVASQRSTTPPAASPPSVRAASGFIDEVPIEQIWLLNLAIVNMEKGIGRGW